MWNATQPESGSPLGDPVAVFAALGDATRLELIARLSLGQTLSITQLAEESELTRQGITKHLRVLERAGIVESKRVGRESRYTYQADTIRQAQTYLDRVSAQWDDALARLKAFVEDENA